MTTAALAGCGGLDEGALDNDPELASVVRQISALPGVEAVGAGRDGAAANLAITVAPGIDSERADELLDEGVRGLWLSEVEPLTAMKVVVTASARAKGGSDRVYDEQDLEQVRDELVAEYGDRPVS